jgi:hypothetical protein
MAALQRSGGCPRPGPVSAIRRANAMPRNIEIKARVPGIDALRPRAQALADGPPRLL